jgi:hypothetical protein
MTASDSAARIAFFQEHIYNGCWATAIPAVAVAAIVGSAVAIGIARDHARWRWLCIPLISAWVICPPVWFIWEYHWISGWPVGELPDIEAFKYSQELASKVWAAAVVLLVAVYKRSVHAPSC